MTTKPKGITLPANQGVTLVTNVGVVGDGGTDDTTALQTAVNTYSALSVPIGCTPLISSTIVVPAGCKLSFQGGENNGTTPAAYLIKKSTMATVGVTLASGAWIEGGAIFGQAGNTGDGIQLLGNGAKLSNFLAKGCGGNGVRIGADTSVNANSCQLDHVNALNNGGHGIYIHDGFLTGGANANACKLTMCVTQGNSGDGIHIGHAFWVSIDTCLSETNTGWGLYLSGTNNNTYPECRWATVIGGDYNEGNAAGQVFDASYCSMWITPDPNSIPTTPPNGLQGSALRTSITSIGSSHSQGLNVETNGAVYPLNINAGNGSNLDYPLVINKNTTAGNNQGAGLVVNLNPSSAGLVPAGSARVVQNVAGVYGWIFAGYRAAAAYDMLSLNANALTVAPSADITLALGVASNRWTQTFTGNVVLSTAAISGGAGTVVIGGTTATTVGAAGAASALPATPLGYIIANVAGTQVKIPYYNN